MARKTSNLRTAMVVAGSLLTAAPTMAQSPKIEKVAPSLAQMLDHKSPTLLQAIFQPHSSQDKSPQFAMFGDTDHEALDIRATVASDSTMQALQDKGYKHLFLEAPMLLQPLADSLVTSKMSRADFIKEMTAKFALTYQKGDSVKEFHNITADMLMNAKKHGIAVHFIDNAQDQMLKAAQELEAQYPNLQELKNWQEIAVDKLLSVRFKADPDIAAKMKSIAGQDRAAIMFGAEHATHTGLNRDVDKHIRPFIEKNHGIVNALGKENVAMIALCTPQDIHRMCADTNGWQRYDVLARSAVKLAPAAAHKLTMK